MSRLGHPWPWQSPSLQKLCMGWLVILPNLPLLGTLDCPQPNMTLKQIIYTIFNPVLFGLNTLKDTYLQFKTVYVIDIQISYHYFCCWVAVFIFIGCFSSAKVIMWVQIWGRGTGTSFTLILYNLLEFLSILNKFVEPIILYSV